MLQRIEKPHNLTQEIAVRLAAQIRTGQLAPGARLPTEHEMVTAMGVSRTVVREAVAALRAEGLVITRQGAGAFVATDAARRPFRVANDSAISLQEVLDVMELRTSMEVEAAGLAAERGSLAAKARIGKALTALERAIGSGEVAVDEDFAFHRAIAEATANPQFARFLEYLGRFIIPRQTLRLSMGGEQQQNAYLAKIQGEHRAIQQAIADGEPTKARQAMRRHLINSRARYRSLASSKKKKT
ncbi:MAG: FadR/GntR family transcriptional regulator [Rhodospirillales bacterium]